MAGSSGAEESYTDDIDLTTLHESGLTQTFDAASRDRGDGVQPAVEANIILIAHPEDKRLGTRFRLSFGTTVEVGRDPDAGISLPEVSRSHAATRSCATPAVR